MPNLFAFLSYVFLTAFTPGPNNITAMSLAGKYGLRDSLRFALGAFAGSVVVMGACATFSALLFSVIPTIEPFMKCVGAAYIAWLAWVVWRDAPGRGHAEARIDSFRTGVIMQFVNVKGFLYGITSFSVFILPYDKSVTSVVLFTILLSVFIYAAVASWGLCGAFFQKILMRHGKLLNGVMALLLLYCAVSLLWPQAPAPLSERPHSACFADCQSLFFGV